MIIYKNLKKYKKTKHQNLIFSIFDEIEKDKDFLCKSFYNLTFQNKVLKTGLGFQDMKVPKSKDDLQDCHTYKISEKIDQLKGFWQIRLFNSDLNEYEYHLYLIDTNFKLWKVALIDRFLGNVFSCSTKLKSMPTHHCLYRIENDDGAVFFSNEGMLFKSFSFEGIYANVPALISCVVHYDNFFGITNTNRNTLIYTTNLNLKKWEEGEKSTVEFLDNRGSFNKLVAFNDYVYIFREYGITKVSIYSVKSDFSFTHLYSSSSKIFENSVCVCGEKVFFMTREGLYTFNGTSVKHEDCQMQKYASLLDNTHCCSACLNGKYYFATRCNFDDENSVGCEEMNYVNNVLFEIDVNSFKVNLLRGVDVNSLVPVDNPYMSKLCASFNFSNAQRLGQLDVSGATFEVSNKKMLETTFTDFGHQAKRKKIKEIFITTIHPLTLTIQSDEETQVLNFDGKNAEQSAKIMIFGRNFKFSFQTDETDCCVKKPMIVYEVVK